MARITSTVWPLEPHTAAKHAILRKYLDAWIPIMARWHGRVLYIDGFAGPGIYEGGEPGSPVIALRAALDQIAHICGEMYFLFIEADAERCERLKAKLAEISLPAKLQAEVVCARFDETVSDILDKVDSSGQQLIPTFAFVDPFGFSHTPMPTLARIMRNPRCEVLVTFMYEEINRFLSHRDFPKTFDALFGCADWRRCLEQATSQERERCVRNVYAEQLRTAAGIKFVRAFKMRNRDDRTDYFLFFGTNGLTGLAKMKEAMWRVDAAGRFEFSDATDQDQVLLFEAGPDFEDLRRRLSFGLAGRKLSIEDVEEYVLVESPYTGSHYKRVLKAMEGASAPGLIVRAAKAGRKRGQFPKGTVVEFVPVSA